ncbi:MAG: hypothetical protein RL477_118 [Pseudomonadota bacterium]|jgi:hypothetical protein
MKAVAACVVIVACAVLNAFAAVPAAAQNYYQSKSGLYSFQMPQGWRVDSEGGNLDVAIVPPGGKSQRSIFFVLSTPKASLDAEMRYAAGQTQIVSSRPVRVSRFDCLYANTRSARGVPAHHVFCHVTVRYRDGPKRVAFGIGAVSHPSYEAEHEKQFWQALSSLNFHQAVTP